MKKLDLVKGKEAQERFDMAMKKLFRTAKPQKHQPKKRKKGKD